MSLDPNIAIAMSVHAGADLRHFRLSVESLFAQDYPAWILFLGCDGPLTADLDQYIQSLPEDRVKIVRSSSNMGLAVSLNRLLDLIVTEKAFDYVARMDADDVSAPQRFSRQIRFLEERPDVGVLGTWCKEIDDAGRIIFEKRLPTEHDALMDFMANRSPLVHPSVMARIGVFHGGERYRPELKLMQDLELWSRLVAKGIRLANLPEYLLFFRRGQDFFSKRGGWRRACQDVHLRWRYMKESHRVSVRNLLYLSGFFLVRIAPTRLKRLAYLKLR